MKREILKEGGLTLIATINLGHIIRVWRRKRREIMRRVIIFRYFFNWSSNSKFTCSLTHRSDRITSSCTRSLISLVFMWNK